MGDLIHFNSPCGRTLQGTPDEICEQAFRNYYSAERRRGVDPDTADRRAEAHIMRRFNDLISDIREAVKEA